ncbi:MAG: hypothetical protein JWP74_4166 [Marmoricola sp.]|nr:hypothetical protein [Marmoricola sp.]
MKRRLMYALVAMTAMFAAVGLTPNATAAGTQVVLNKPPTARITGQTSGIFVGDTITYSGTGSSDPGGKIAGYAWSATAKGAVVGSATASTAAVTFTAAGTTTISLTVTDNGLLNGLFGPVMVQKATTTLDVTVKVRPNGPPVFGAPGPQISAPTGYFASGSVAYTDPDGDDVDITKVVCSGCVGTPSIYNNSTNAGVPNALQHGGFSVNTACYPRNIGLEITISDGHGHEATTYRSIVVYQGTSSCTG